MGHVQLNVCCNTDDAFLVWKADEIDGCLGFAIERQWLQTSVTGRVLHQSEYLLNRVGFATDVAAGPGQYQPSNVWPFQRYNWTDHDLSLNDMARYRIVPMVGAVGDLLAELDAASAWVEASAQQPENGRLSCFFNRPMAASPWMARIAAEHDITSSSKLVQTIANVESDFLRDFCGGTLIFALRNLFDYADSHPHVHLYAALFELEDEEIIHRFCKLGGRAHIVLSNGSAKPKNLDVNQEGRQLVHNAGCDVIDRMTPVGDLGHNKFIVIVDDAQPVRVWTGSTNLTPTGIFTQINNAILIDSAELADQYLTQWKRLAAAESAAPSTLKADNPAPGAGTKDPAAIEPWFAPTVKKLDLARLQELVDGAQEGILFLTFMPGPSGPILDVLKARAKGAYVRGVLNQFVDDKQHTLHAELIAGSANDPMNLDAITPSGIKAQFSFWASEFMKGGKISVFVHSKVLCIDPFGENPIVVTGSHNFSPSASEGNDENFLVIQGDKDLARSYAAHIISVYNHYRWRQYVAATLAAGNTPWQKLEGAATWQNSRLHSVKQIAEWKFWLDGSKQGA